MKDLASQNVKAIGIIRDHRIKNCSLIPAKKMKKVKRGCFDYQTDELVFLCH